MKISAPPASVLVLLLAPLAPAQEEVVHDLVVALDPQQGQIRVQDEVRLPASLTEGSVEFTLNAALTIDSCAPRVTEAGGEGDLVKRYLVAEPPASGVLHLCYSGPLADPLSDQKEEYTRGFRETRGTVGPEGVFLDGGSDWVPEFGERMLRFSVEVACPEGWHVISQGSGTSRDAQGRARWESGAAMEQVYLVGGPLVVERDTAGAVETLVYLHEPDPALSQKYLDATARYLEMYRTLIGPYPYGKFALVENFWETGYGMPSFTLLGPQVIRFPFILHTSYPHEILHNWWGNSVFVDYESGNWCEGLTAYMADHLIQEQRGQGSEYRRSTLQRYRDYVQEGLDFPLREFVNRHSAATEAVGYGKALMTFHMLRLRLGDEAFRTGLVDFYRAQRGRRAGFDDLESAWEGVAGEELAAYFDQWVERAGAPVLVLEDAQAVEAEGGFAVAGLLRQVQEGAPYALDVPVEVRTEAGIETFSIALQEREHSFRLELASRPLTVAVDPRFDLFRLLDPRETPASIGQIFGEPSVLAVLPTTTAEEAELTLYRELMDAWQSDQHALECVGDGDLQALPADRPVWILGRENRYAAGFADAAREAGVAGEGRSTVVIRRHPENVELAIGHLVVEPVAAFPGMARKLPHYGKYSYLAFEGEEPTNVVKGQWTAEGSPLHVDLRPGAAEALPPLAPPQRAALAELPPVFSSRALLEEVAWLAADERAGRGLGTPELDQCAERIARALEAAGLEPGGDEGGWFQSFVVAEGPDGEPVEARNVVGILRGTRADWADQSVVLGAHYDHLGRGWPDAHAGDEGRIHPGADDNASGVAVLLELARNLAAEGARSRSLVVVAFSAEECGRHGSRHYVEHPSLPAAGIRGVVNLDTVGRLRDQPLAIHGTGTASEWQHIFRGCGFVTGIQSKNVPGGAEGSDQWSFIERGIPGVQVFTGAHGDYHRPGDSVEKVDVAGLVKVATFVKEALSYLLEREEPLTVTIEGAAATAPQPRAGGRRVSFGTVPDFAFQGPGVRVSSVVENSPAARAGLTAGDVLLRLDGQVIADLRAFSEFLKTLEPGQRVATVVERAGEEVELEVQVVAR